MPERQEPASSITPSPLPQSLPQAQALRAFAALSQDTRLRILRRLITAGPQGLAAGLLAEELGVTASNISFHIKELDRAGLVQARRESRSVIYRADFAAMAGLIAFLTEDCCAGQLGLCAPLAASCNTGPCAAG